MPLESRKKSSLSFAQRIGATPSRITLVGVLSVILIGSLIVQFGDSDGHESPSPSEAPSPSETPSESVLDKSRVTQSNGLASDVVESPGRPRRFIRWPSVRLGEVIDYDPFARPAPEPDVSLESYTARRQPVETSRATIEAAPAVPSAVPPTVDLQVDMVVKSGNNWLAIVDQQEMRVGDVINGVKIKEISRDGVVVQRVVKSASGRIP